MGTAAAIIASAVIGTGTSLYTANEQEKAAEEAEAKRLRAEEEAEAERKRIAANTMPEQEVAGEGIEFGIQDDSIGSVNEFLVERTPTSQLGSTGGSGLGFSI